MKIAGFAWFVWLLNELSGVIPLSLKRFFPYIFVSKDLDFILLA